MSGILAIGNPNQPLLDIPVAEGCTGMVIVAGLNPIAALREVDAGMTIRSLAGLERFERFQPYRLVKEKLIGYSRMESGGQWHIE